MNDTVQALTAQDDQGALPLTGPTRAGEEDLWRSTRAVRGDVTIRYRVPAASKDAPHFGPITYLQDSGAGLSGAFESFLLRPISDAPVDVALRWHLAPGEQAVTSVGIGDLRQKARLSDLGGAMFVAGPLVHTPSKLSAGTLTVAALGVSQAEVDGASPWLARAFTVMRSAFHGDPTEGYRIMVFSHDRHGFHSGTSRAGGFLFFLPKGQPFEDQENHAIIAHEMVHSMVRPYGTGPDGTDDWYNEGIADYAAITVPNAAGLYSPRAYLGLVNQEAAFYYLNPARVTPNARIPDVKWSGRAWSLGYTRGALYFANLDAGLRARGLKARVLTLIDRMNATARRGPVDAPAWEALLQREAGPWAVAQWLDMLAGKHVEPASGAFGPCYVARPIHAGHYTLGIGVKDLRAGTSIDRVDPSSYAYKAGLRSGDVLREPIKDMDKSFDQNVIIRVTRDGKPIDFTFSPRAGTELAYRWFARSGNPDRPCGLRRRSPATA
ncbi:hypothetical protein J2X47_004115 [Sphingomonas sp. BE270]|jgi:hypothetical protein|uniref:hypothetical protein n=1 Tax=Sphingomonas sp. BE270 TaxID=2817726 RepID=UPI0028625ADC|nr:hypothetical protein [Sphingomonas sp. BE270]MDR7259907.1 hypothetical protein [Sphingomonas sp. BE270]